MDPVLLAFVTGLTTGGLSCLAVQGGLLATSIADEVQQSVENQGAPLAGGAAALAPSAGAAASAGLGPKARFRAGRPIILFLGAKVVAYTVLGFLLGWLGSFFQLSPLFRSVLLVAIGIFMVGTALRMLNVHPIFRFFSLEPPASVRRYIRRKAKDPSGALTPIFLGALTVLIPCGVTQAMMAVAMASGSPLNGATIMFAFTLGTTPVFFAVAYAATSLGARLEKKFVTVVAVMVLVLGAIAIDSGMTLAGFPYSPTNLRMAAAGRASSPLAAAPLVAPPLAAAPTRSLQAVTPPAPADGQPSAEAPLVAAPSAEAPSAPLASIAPAVSATGAITVTVSNDGYAPPVTRALAGVPVTLSLVSKDTYSCARAFVIQSLGIERMLPETGTVKVEIPPQKPGSKLFYACSMGMYSGVIMFDS
jgi:sulfite exporter TauE/SafE